MRRRDLLKGGLAAAALGASRPAEAGDPIARALARIDLQIARLRERTAPMLAALPAFSGQPGLDEALSGALDALVAYGGVASLDEEAQADPRVQERLWATARGMGRSLDRFALELDSLDEDALEALHAGLADKPELVESGLAALAEETRALDIPKRAREQLLATVEQTAFDLAHGQKSGATRRHLARFQRLKRRVQKSADRLELLERPPVDELRARKAQASGAPMDEPPPERAGDEDISDEQAAVLGGLLLALGIANGVLFTYGLAGSSGFLALCICVGVPMLAATVLLLVAGAALLQPEPEY